MTDKDEQLTTTEELDPRSFGEWVEDLPLSQEEDGDANPRAAHQGDSNNPPAHGEHASSSESSSQALELPPLLLDVRTGEALEPTAENASVLLYALRDHKRQVVEAIKVCELVIHAEARRQGTKTLALPGGKVEVRTGTTIHWNLELLEELRKLGLPEERWHDLVTETVEYKVSARVANQIAASNPSYARIIEAARTTHDKPPYVSVR